MANLRFFGVNAVVRNITFAEHRCLGVVVRREKHLFVRNALLNKTCTDSRELLAGLRSTNPYNLLYRFEHGIPGASVTEINENLSSPPPSPPPHSSDGSLNAKETTIDKNVQSPLTEAPQGTNISENQGITELAGSLNEVSLPPIPQIVNPEVSLPIGEESLASLGLGGWFPAGIIQQELQFLHVTFDLPWWACIVCTTVVLRFMVLPFQIKGRQLINTLFKTMTEFQKLQTKIDDARKTGNTYEIIEALQEQHSFTQKNNILDFKALFYMSINTPIFISFFFALNKMAETPALTSFQTGGLFWFTNLTVPDQFYLLPCIMGLSVHFLIKKGLQYQPNSIMKTGALTVLPIAVIWFMSKCPAAVLCYSVTSNLFSVAQTLLLNIKIVQEYFQIPQQVPPPKSRNSKKGPLDKFLEQYRSTLLLRELEDRERLNAIKFEESSSAPMKRTFKYKPSTAQVLLQKKNKPN